MNPQTTQCDDQALLDMLAEHLEPDEHERVAAHLEACEHCQQRLEALTASESQWQRAANAAKHFESTVDGVGHPETPEAAEGRISWNESMARQLLSPPTHPEMLGRLGRYEIERLVGAGGMGIVFKAYDTELNRPVAIKLLAPHLSQSTAARERFAREARAAAAVVHQHVVPIHNVETERESPYLVMQFIAGDSLQARIDRNGALELKEILRIGSQVADGLAAAHDQGLVHRDIKPSNILMEEDVERALIGDFGLARAADDSSLTRTGFNPGTPQYMSPEQAAGKAVDFRSDLFSLGSMLYTMCTGHAPFQSTNSLSLMRDITESQPSPIQEVNPELPDWLCGVINKLMAKDPDQRFASAAEVHTLLEGCLSHVQQPQTYALPAIPIAPQPNTAPAFLKSIPGVLTMLALLSTFTVGMTMLFLGNSTENKLATMKGPDMSMKEVPDEAVLAKLYTVDAGALDGERSAAICDLGPLRIALLGNDINHGDESSRMLPVTLAGEDSRQDKVPTGDGRTRFQYSYADGIASCQLLDLKFRASNQHIWIGDDQFSFDPDEKPGRLITVDSDTGRVSIQDLEAVEKRVILPGRLKDGSKLALQVDSIDMEQARAAMAANAANHPDVKNIQGTWQVTYSEDSGRVAPDEMLKGLQMIFDETTMTMDLRGRKNDSTYQIDPSNDPKTIDMKNNGRTSLGIYDLQGGTLRICLSEGSDKRPTAFDSQPNSANDVVIIMKRVDPDAQSKDDKPDSSGPMTVQLARYLIPKAASMDLAAFDKLAKAPNPKPLANETLSMVLLSLPMKKDATQPANFEPWPGYTPHPADLAAMMARSRAKGFASMIQPEDITKCVVKANDDQHASGQFTFKVPQHYLGTIDFSAVRKNGSWVINRFLLPHHQVAVELQGDGSWKRVMQKQSENTAK